MPMDMTDTTAPASRAGTDPQTWLARYGDYLYRFALARVRNPTVAEDVVQDTLLAAFKGRRSFAGRSAERSWLTGILKHKIIDHFRKTSRESPVEDVEPWTQELAAPFTASGHYGMEPGQGPAAWDPEAVRALEQQEFRAILTQCLAGLPPRLAAAFTLREMDGLGSPDICKTLGVTATNLWVMLHRARLQLRRCLEARWFADRAERGG